MTQSLHSEPIPIGPYTAECVIYAQTYVEAIEEFGQHMDRIYGPKWRLTKAHAYPHVQIGSVDKHNKFTWQWDMLGESLGQVQSGHTASGEVLPARSEERPLSGEASQ